MLALRVVLVCFIIFPGTVFAIICKQERSVCYLLRLSENTAYYPVRRRSTQSKRISISMPASLSR